MNPYRALNEYRQTSVEAGTAYADPHTLIDLLFDGLQDKLAIAKGALEHGDMAVKGSAIGRAIDILSYLQACLDHEKGGSVAANLDALYDHLVRRLYQASAENSRALLDEVGDAIKRVQSGWKGIREAALAQATAPES